MPRTNDTPATRTSPVGRYSYWGAYDAVADLPNSAAGLVQSNHLDVGDLASVGSALYICTSAAPALATWVQMLKATVTANMVVTGTASFSGALTPSAGIVPVSTPSGFHNWQPIAATSGTDTTPADGTQFVTSIFVPCNFTVTGVKYLIGSVGGTDKVYAALYTAAGALVGNSSVAGGGATVGTAAQRQSLALTATAAITGPAMYFVGISMNGTTARLRTIPIYTEGSVIGNSVAQTHGTVAAITAPTSFNDAKCPVVSLY